MAREEDEPYQNPAAGLEIPVMAPRGAVLRGRERDEQQHVRGEVHVRDGEQLERTRMTGQRPVQGLGEPQPFQPAIILNQAHGLLEQYKKDPSRVDPVFVQIMMLEALGTFGSKAAKVDQLTQEVARLRKAVESMGVEGERDKPKTRIERLRAKRAANGRDGGRRFGGGGLRGRLSR